MTTRTPLAYVAGPMTADPYGCVRKATSAYRILRSMGVTPFLPQLSVLHEMIDPLPYDEWLAYDFEIIRHCQLVVRLPGDSPGADAEVAYAKTLGLPVFHLEGGEFGRNAPIHRWLEEYRAEQIAPAAGPVPPPCPADPGSSCEFDICSKCEGSPS